MRSALRVSDQLGDGRLGFTDKANKCSETQGSDELPTPRTAASQQKHLYVKNEHARSGGAVSPVCCIRCPSLIATRDDPFASQDDESQDVAEGADLRAENEKLREEVRMLTQANEELRRALDEHSGNV